MEENKIHKKYTIETETVQNLLHVYLIEHTNDFSFTNYRCTKSITEFSLGWIGVEDDINKEEYPGKLSHLIKINDHKIIISIKQPSKKENKLMFIREPNINRTIISLKNTINENIKKLKIEILKKFFQVDSDCIGKNFSNKFSTKEIGAKSVNNFLKLKRLGNSRSYKEPSRMKILSACFFTDDTIIYSTHDSLKFLRLKSVGQIEIKGFYIKSIIHLLTLKKKWVVASSIEKTIILNIISTEKGDISYIFVASFLHVIGPIHLIAELSNNRLVSCFKEVIEIKSLEIPFDRVWFFEEKVYSIFETKNKKYFVLVTEEKKMLVFESISYKFIRAISSLTPGELQNKYFFSIKDEEIVSVSNKGKFFVVKLPSFEGTTLIEITNKFISYMKLTSFCTFENELFFFLFEGNKEFRVYYLNSELKIKCLGFALHFCPKNIIFQGKYLFLWDDDNLGWIETEFST